MKKLIMKAALLALALLPAACVKEIRQETEANLTITCSTVRDETKSAFTLAEDRVKDWNVYIYYGGKLEAELFGEGAINVELTEGQSYNLYALANVGKVDAPVLESGLKAMECRIAGVSSFNSSGLPMVGEAPGFTVSGDADLTIRLERLVARYDFNIDKSDMDFSSFQVQSVRVRQSALTVYPFDGGSAATEVGDCDYASATDISRLESGHSVSLYMLENSRGVLLPDNTDQWQKVPDRIESGSGLCTYLEVSGLWTTPGASADVTYRMFLGRDNHSDFNVDRNTTNTLSLSLTDEGVGRESWKVTRSNMNDARVLHFASSAGLAYKQKGYYSMPVIREPSGLVYGVTADAAALLAASADWYLSGDTLYYRSADPGPSDLQVPFCLSSWDGAAVDSLTVTFSLYDPVFQYWEYSAPVITLSYPHVPANGNMVSPVITYTQKRYAHYDDGSSVFDSDLSGSIDPASTSGTAFIKTVSGVPSNDGGIIQSLGYPYTAQVGAANLGTTETALREVMQVSLTCLVNGVEGQGSATVYQQANTYTSQYEEVSEKYDYSLEIIVPSYSSPSSPCPAAGDAVEVCVKGGCTVRNYSYTVRTYTSGSVENADYEYENPRRSGYYGLLQKYGEGAEFITIQKRWSETVDGDGCVYYKVTVAQNTSEQARNATLTVSAIGVFATGDVTTRIYQAGMTSPDPPTPPSPVLTGISVSPSSLDLVLGDHSSISVWAHYSDGSSVDITASAGLSSDSPNVGVSAGGGVSAAGLGSATLTARYSGFQAGCAVSVNRPPLQGISLSASTLVTRTGEAASLTITPVPSEALLGNAASYVITAPQTALYWGVGLEDNHDNSFTLTMGGHILSGSQTVTLDNGSGISASFTHTNKALITSISSAAGKGIATVSSVVFRPGNTTDHFFLAAVPQAGPEQWLDQGYDDISVTVTADEPDGSGRRDISDRFTVSKSYTSSSLPADDAGVVYFEFRPSSLYGTYYESIPITFRNVSVTFTSREKGVSYSYPQLSTLETYYR